MEAVAIYDFQATQADELTFQKGQIVKILSIEDDPNWYKAEKDNKRGLVPKNYIQIKEQDWYFGKISRANSEGILKDQPDGTFLVRDSESTPGDFSISVKFEHNVQHFKVLRDSAGKYFLWLVKFDSLNQMVDYHKSSSVSRSQKIFLKHPANTKTVVIAKYDFVGTEDGELAIKKGDEITVTDESDANWWQGKNKRTGKEGMFPVPYVTKK